MRFTFIGSTLMVSLLSFKACCILRAKSLLYNADAIFQLLKMPRVLESAGAMESPAEAHIFFIGLS